MAALPNILQDEPNPMDVVEAVASMRGWNFERPVDDEINMTVEGSWSDLHVCLNWRDDLESVHLAATFDLRITSGRREEASRLEAAVEKVLADGVRTADLMQADGGAPVSTSEMGDAIIAALDASL